MTDYICSSPTASGDFTFNTPARINEFLCGEVNLSSVVFYGCPPWTGILTDVAIDNIWYNNIEVKLTLQTNEYDLYETDYITHTVPHTTLEYIAEDESYSDGYTVSSPFYSAFDFKVYVLACANKTGIRIYYRVNNFKTNYGSNLFGDTLIDYGYNLTCPDGIWADCSTGFGSNPCGCPIIQSGILKYA